MKVIILNNIFKNLLFKGIRIHRLNMGYKKKKVKNISNQGLLKNNQNNLFTKNIYIVLKINSMKIKNKMKNINT